MKLFKITAVTLLLVLSTPLVISFVSAFYSQNTEIVFCETSSEEEQKDQRETDDIEECLLGEHLVQETRVPKVLSYSFMGKSFIDIVTDIVTPPPELCL